MRYSVTKDLETGNVMIDSEHRELFQMINNLQDACSQGKGRSQVGDAAKYLVDYTKKHFQHEDDLQKKSGYPGFAQHSQFHTEYKKKFQTLVDKLVLANADIASLAALNQEIGVLISHIRIEDRKLAAYVKTIN